jgi:hypothetical protein
MLLLHVEHQAVRVLYLTVYDARLTDAPVARGTSGSRCFVSDCVLCSTYGGSCCVWNVSGYVFCTGLRMALDLQILLLHVEHQDVRVSYLTVYGARLTDAPLTCGTSACMYFVSDCVWRSTYRCSCCMWNVSVYVFRI